MPLPGDCCLQLPEETALTTPTVEREGVKVNTHNLASQIKDVIGVDVYLCYQCEKCSCGCPVSPEMDLIPAQIMHAAQLNFKQKIMSVNTIWYCASCETCTTRCPQGIDISKVMDALRIIARREKIKAKVPLVPIFYNLCLMSLKWVGCIYEIGVAGYLRIRAGTVFKELPLVKAYLSKGKLGLFPKFRNVFQVKRIIRKVRKIEGYK